MNNGECQGCAFRDCIRRPINSVNIARPDTRYVNPAMQRTTRDLDKGFKHLTPIHQPPPTRTYSRPSKPLSTRSDTSIPPHPISIITEPKLPQLAIDILIIKPRRCPVEPGYGRELRLCVRGSLLVVEGRVFPCIADGHVVYS